MRPFGSHTKHLLDIKPDVSPLSLLAKIYQMKRLSEITFCRVLQASYVSVCFFLFHISNCSMMTARMRLSKIYCPANIQNKKYKTTSVTLSAKSSNNEFQFSPVSTWNTVIKQRPKSLQVFRFCNFVSRK